MEPTIVKSELEQALIALCDPPLATLGLATVDLECRPSRTPTVRVFIERKGGEGAIGFAECASASEALGPVLDGAPALEAGYELEVSSPGLDRRLRLSSHFARALGESVRLKLVAAKEGFGANIAGTLEAVVDDRVVVDVDGRPCALALGEVTRAHVVWKAAEAARPGKSPKGRSRENSDDGRKELRQ